MSSEGKKTGVDEGSRPALAPKLRFPEFSGQTAQKVELRHVTAESTLRNSQTLPASAVMGVSKVNGIVPMEERIVASDIGRYKIVKEDWFAYNPMRLNIGSIARWQGDRDILVSPDYIVFRCLNGTEPGLHAAFLDQFRQSVAWKNFVTQGGDGGVRVRIYYDDIGLLELTLPALAEQKEISDCLNSVDELIKAQARKVDALKKHKKGLMQDLFPREGKTQPRRRFPEFQDAGEWSQDLLGNVCAVLNNRRRPITSGDRKPGPYRYYGASGVVDYIDDYIFDERVILVGEDGAKWGAFERTAFIVEGKFWVNNHAHVLKPLGVNDTLLENYLTMADFGPYVTGAAPPKLTLGKLKEIPVPIPPDEKEAQAIASCLSSLDALTAAETQKLEALKRQKRGLMQQLFPSSAEAEG
jgi:type I restriction enzyme S subunit